MVNFKRFLSFILVLTITLFISCTKVKEENMSNLDLFDVFKGKDIVSNYFINIINGDLKKANELCVDELVKDNVNLSEGVSYISSFQIDKTIASSDFAYYIINVIRDSNLEPKSDLESYTVKVNRDKENYIISEVKATTERQLYIKNNDLRIIGEKGGKSSLVISLNNIPKDSYLRENKLMLYKEKVPNNSFGKVVLGFTGQKVAISTIDDKNAFICIAYIDNTSMENGTKDVAYSENSQGSSINDLQEGLEKPIASKVVAVDLLNDAKVEKFVFSKEDNNLAVNYKNKNGVDRVNIYKADDGSIIETNFNEMFNEEVYNIKARYFDEYKLIFEVYKSDSNSDDVTGTYIFNINNGDTIKL